MAKCFTTCTSSNVLALFSLTVCVMLATSAPTVHIRQATKDGSGCKLIKRKDIYDEITTDVSSNIQLNCVIGMHVHKQMFSTKAADYIWPIKKQEDNTRIRTSWLCSLSFICIYFLKCSFKAPMTLPTWQWKCVKLSSPTTCWKLLIIATIFRTG